MKKENTLLVILGGVAVLGLSYFLYRRFTKKGEQKADEIRQQGQQGDQPADDLPPLLPTGTGNPLADLASNITNFLSRYQDYEVVTKTSNLNVRSKPDSTAKVIGSLKKGSTVRAKASGVKGWFAISDNDKDIKGYVAQSFLKPKTK